MPPQSLVNHGSAGPSAHEQPAPFHPRTAAPFVNKSLSEETRRLYHRVIREFFRFVAAKNETRVTQQDVLRWRDAMIRDGRRASTVALKLSVLRSFFEYLRAYGRITLNPAATRLVPPPPVADDPAGRALVAKEARRLFAGPDRRKPEGARDHAVMLIMGRMSLRVAEVAAHVGQLTA